MKKVVLVAAVAAAFITTHLLYGADPVTPPAGTPSTAPSGKAPEKKEKAPDKKMEQKEHKGSQHHHKK